MKLWFWHRFSSFTFIINQSSTNVICLHSMEKKTLVSLNHSEWMTVNKTKLNHGTLIYGFSWSRCSLNSLGPCESSLKIWNKNQETALNWGKKIEVPSLFLFTPIELLVNKRQSRSVTRNQIIDSSTRWFAVNVDHPIDLVNRSPLNPTYWTDAVSPHGHHSSEVVARILCGSQFQDVVGIGSVAHLNTCTGRRAFAFGVHRCVEIELDADADL